MSSIKVSEKYGVNPSMLICPICGGDAGIALMGRLPNDAEAPHKQISDALCSDCEKVMKAGGGFLVEAEDKNGEPYRTGFTVGLSKEAFDRLAQHMGWDKKVKVCHVEPEELKQLMGEELYKTEKEKANG